MSLQGFVIEAASVKHRQRNDMYALMQAHYDNVRRDVFEADLAEKQWVILLMDGERRVWGFSTQMLLQVPWAGQQITALFSGDTIVHREFWGRNPLSRVWGHFALSLIDRFPNGSLYWFLISKGYKTYRFLPAFFRHFCPDYGRAPSELEAALLAAFGRRKFPESFDADTGIVRAEVGQCCLSAGVADITPTRRMDPHVAFFEQRNPGHQRGDELCCLAPLLRENFTAAAYRVMGLPCPALVQRKSNSQLNPIIHHPK